MKSYFKKILFSVSLLVLLSMMIASISFAQQSVSVSLPTFKITMNNVKIDNNERLYPVIVYKDITYVPMTYKDSRFLGLETKWSFEEGLQVNKITTTTNYNPDRGYSSSVLESAYIPESRIRVNGKEIYNKSETYPLLLFRDITYFPLTWRFMVDEFGWSSSFDAVNGLIINSHGDISSPPTSTVESGKVFAQDFGSIKVIFDRSTNNQPGNLYVKENNYIRQIGNPNYIYGVGYLQAGTYGQYTAVDKVEYANRWIYTLAVDPSVYPIVSRDVRINIDTNEVQTVEGTTIGEPPITLGDKVYSKQFGNVTLILDRTSDREPGNLYVKENNIIRRVGNLNYIYGVSYFRIGPFESYNPVDKLNLTGRWAYTTVIDTTKSTLTSRDAKINIDTNEVTFL